jgi:Ca-activated chloride channel family protein
VSLAPRGPACARALALSSLVLVLSTLAACAGVDPDAGSGGSGPAPLATDAPTAEADDEPIAAPAPPPARRGVGTVSARVPGTDEIVGGVSVVSHDVTVSVRDGFARTEIREEVRNDGDRVLEGRYLFPLPPGASVGRLALWVGRELVEGEIVEQKLASRIFRGIVEDTVRPRDPALLEWVSGSEVRLTIFPIPPHSSRKVLLAYDEILPRAPGRGAYVLPLSLGADRAASIEHVAFDVAVEEGGAPARDVATPGHDARVDVEGGATRVRFAADRFAPKGDFVVTFARAAEPPPIEAAWGTADGASREGFVAIRARAELGESRVDARAPLDRVIAIDVSQSQSPETIAAEAKVALALVRRLGAGDRASVLACDSSCERYPGDPRASLRALAGWLGALAPRGSSDLAGAILAGVRAMGADERRAQLVLLGDGAPTSGELAPAAIADRVRPALAARHVDLALLGVGRTVDEVVLGALARSLGGTVHRVADGAPIAERARSLAERLDAPVLADARLELPAGLVDPAPAALPNLRVGDDVVVYARRAGDAPIGPVALVGRVADREVRVEAAIAAPSPARDVAPVPRLWAEARLGELEADASREARAASIALSKRFHVMTRATAWLVLESDRMFEEFGIPRTQRPRGDDRLGLVAPRLAPVDPGAPLGESLAGGGEAPGHAPLASASAGSLARALDSAAASSLGLIGSSGDTQSPRASASALSAPSAGVASGQGFGAGHGRLGGSHRTKPPQVRMGACTVSGRLPPEAVRRIVRLNFGRFRACYERGLTRNPDLAGRVSTRFVIDRAGGVAATSNAGSDLPDAEVVACVVRSFGALSFPQPEGGIVTVIYPIVFSSDGTRPRVPPALPADTPSFMPPNPVWPTPPPPPPPSIVIAPSDEAWRGPGDALLAKLAAAVDDKPAVRSRHEALVRPLVARGRFVEAVAAARRYVDSDPDRAPARELLASALATSGDGAAAARALDDLAELAPRSDAGHARAARAFEAAGDEARACAHWRSLAELVKDGPAKARDEALAEALRCRARVEGDRDAALVAARAASDKPGPLARLAAALDGGLAPPYAADALPAGALEVTASCDGGACPSVVVVAPDGSAFTPFTPSSRARSARGRVALPAVGDGVYRVLAAGAGAASIAVRALGAERTFRVEGGGVRSVASVTVRGAS